MQSPAFEFRPLTADDIPRLWNWLNRPHVAQWWRGEQSLDDVREKYLPRIAGNDTARPYLALLNGEPAGYIQYYLASEGDPAWWPDRPGKGVLGIDQFLSDGARLDQGLGTAMVSQFVAMLMRDEEVVEVRVDPSPDNARAIRCYEKAGFETVGPVVTPDGPALMMVLKREPTDRIQIRDVTPDDLPVFFEHQRDRVAVDMADFPSRDRDAFMAHWGKILADGRLYKQTIVFDGHVAGNVVCFERGGRREVGYWIGREFWGRGIATRALSLFLTQVRTRPLYAGVAGDNIASIRVLEKCGFVTAHREARFSDLRNAEIEEVTLRLD
jgi:RimJ/RimL family protein N-acetyltransferase